MCVHEVGENKVLALCMQVLLFEMRRHVFEGLSSDSLADKLRKNKGMKCRKI